MVSQYIKAPSQIHFFRLHNPFQIDDITFQILFVPGHSQDMLHFIIKKIISLLMVIVYLKTALEEQTYLEGITRF